VRALATSKHKLVEERHSCVQWTRAIRQAGSSLNLCSSGSTFEVRFSKQVLVHAPAVEVNPAPVAPHTHLAAPEGPTDYDLGAG